MREQNVVFNTPSDQKKKFNHQQGTTTLVAIQLNNVVDNDNDDDDDDNEIDAYIQITFNSLINCCSYQMLE